MPDQDADQLSDKELAPLTTKPITRSRPCDSAVRTWSTATDARNGRRRVGRIVGVVAVVVVAHIDYGCTGLAPSLGCGRLSDVVWFGSDWGHHSDLEKLDYSEKRKDRLALAMVAGDPAPIVVLDNPDGLKERGGPMSHWHLIEGHLRLTYLRCLIRRGTAKPEHDVWVMNFITGESSKNGANPRGRISADYTRQKLDARLNRSRWGDGSVKERLTDAVSGQILHLSEDDFLRPSARSGTS